MGSTWPLPGSYTPSRHDSKLTEVATAVVGQDGWFVTTDPAALTAAIIPGEPPMFPAVIPYPMHRLGIGDPTLLLIGCALPAAGAQNGPEVCIDWAAQSFVLLAGMPGSGRRTC